jgi:PST family polysaccharide transporter
VTSVLSAAFLFNAAGVQHNAHLERQLRFTTIAGIEAIALCAGVTTAIGMALRGYGYWALVAMTVVPPFVSTTCLWWSSGWIPGLPRRGVDLASMLRFGGTVTLNGLVVYLAYNLEKVLLGRFWGAEALGIYGRAYQLVNIPTANLNSAAGGVAFPALSRVQHDPQRFRSYFLKGYSLVLAVTLPITIVCALFANDLIIVVLGPKWNGTADVFRLLAPTILIFAMINPLAWLLFSLGLVGRSLKVALALAPVVIFGYVMGLSHGPKGVALGYSTMIALWAVPHIAWCVHGTVVTLRDILAVLSRPFAAGLAAAVLPLGFQVFYGHHLTALPRLVIGGSLFAAVYAAVLLGAMGQKRFYLDLLSSFKQRSTVREKALASA